jgi:uncharacterized protein (DUF362 family)
MSSKPDVVSIVKANADIEQALSDCVSLIGELNVSNPPIIIKPNLCTEHDPSGGATTSLQVIRVLIDYLLEKNKSLEIKIVESDSFQKHVEKAFHNLGYYKLEKAYQSRGCRISVINLTKEPTVTLSLDGLYFKRVKIPKILLKGFFISVAKAKTHEMTHITGALKNQLGCLPEKEKYIHHKHINEAIADINKIIKPNLCIIDGIIGMEGVFHGKLKKLGVLICGRNPVSTDATLARIIGFNPAKIKHIMLSERYGLGTLNPMVIGEEIESVVMKFKKPPLSIPYRAYLLAPKPLDELMMNLYHKHISHAQKPDG